MNDSTGGTFMLYVLIFFLVVYIIFIALTLNYAKSFKLKNKLIDTIEKYEGENCIIKLDSEAITPNENCTKEMNDIISTYQNDIVRSNNIKAVTMKKNINSDNTCYYSITVSIPWEFPLFGINGDWKIKGETRNVEYCTGG